LHFATIKHWNNMLLLRGHRQLLIVSNLPICLFTRAQTMI